MFLPEGLSFPETSEYTLNTRENKFELTLPKGELVYYPHFLNREKTFASMRSLLKANNLDFTNPLKCPFSTEELEKATWQNIPWKRDKVKLFGKEHFTPRFTSWHGEPGAAYSYSNNLLKPNGWTANLIELKQKIEEVSWPDKFNSVLLNWYRNGEDHMGWHSDDEKELGKNPTIASLNLGTSRKFVLRRKANHQEKIEIILHDGDLLIMRGETQHFWQHYLPKQKKVKGNRFNLTFREIKSVK